MVYYKAKESKQTYYGNENSKTRELRIKSVIEDKQFLISWAEGWIKTFWIG